MKFKYVKKLGALALAGTLLMASLRNVSILEFCVQTEFITLIMALIKTEMLEHCYMYMAILPEHLGTAQTA